MNVRLDKWLWAVRLFKTRSLASMACRKGKVSVNGMTARSSKLLKAEDLVSVDFPGIVRTYRVLETIEKRVGAKLAPQAAREETDRDLLERFEALRRDPLAGIFAVRPRGSGRPSKKERREMDQFTTPHDDDS